MCPDRRYQPDKPEVTIIYALQLASEEFQINGQTLSYLYLTLFFFLSKIISLL